MNIEVGRIELSSGATVRTHYGVVGLSHNLRLYGGYDDSGDDLALTAEDRKELAEYMIEQWKRFAAAAPPSEED